MSYALINVDPPASASRRMHCAAIGITTRADGCNTQHPPKRNAASKAAATKHFDLIIEVLI